jgi:broad specificity phosphatase PhoE
MKLILTRHVETIENQRGILQGQNPGTLSKNGKLQAKKLAKRLKDEKIDVIYSSDLKRAVDTTKEIAKYHKNVKIIYSEKLREISHGSFAGRFSKDVDWNNPPNDIEKPLEVRIRAKMILDDAYKKYKNKTVLFVSHGFFNRVLFSIIENRPIEDIMNIQKFENTSLSIFEIKEDNKHVIYLLNCIKHL